MMCEFLRTSTILFAKIINNKGPKMDPCGIPQVTKTNTRCYCNWLWWNKSSENHSNLTFHILYAFNFCSSFAWYIVSNALLKSVKTHPMSSLESAFLQISLHSKVRASSVNLFAWKPNWRYDNSLLSDR